MTRAEKISRSMASRYQDLAFAAIHVPRVREHLKNQKADPVFAEHQSEASRTHMTQFNHEKWHVARNKWSRKCVLCNPVTV